MSMLCHLTILKKLEVKSQYGVIAEDVNKIISSVVTIPKNYDENDPSLDNVPSVDYSKFVPYFIKMIQIQQKEIDNLKELIQPQV